MKDKDKKIKDKKNAQCNDKPNASKKYTGSDNTKGSKKPSGKESPSPNERDDKQTGKKTQGKPWIQGNSVAGNNDPNWYLYSADALNKIASIPWLEKVGLSRVLKQQVPGIMVLEYAPTLGSATQQYASAIGGSNTSTEAALLYATLYNGYTAVITSIEPPDLLMYTSCVYSMLTAMVELKRILRLHKRFSAVNSYYGEALMSALGVSYSFVRDNYKDLCAGWDIRMSKIATTFRVPMESNLLARWTYLNGAIFKDSEEEQSQIYVFKPRNYFLYSGFDVSSGTAIKYLSNNFHNTTNSDLVDSVNTFFATVDAMMAAMENNTDVANFSNAIYKGWAEASVIKYNVTDLSEDLDFTYDELMMHQIHNAEIYTCTTTANIDKTLSISYGALGDDLTPGPLPTSIHTLESTAQGPNSSTIYWQYGGQVVGGIVARMDNLVSVPDKILDIHSANPTPADVLEATRLMVPLEDVNSLLIPVTTSSGSKEYGFGNVSTGSEILCGCYLWYRVKTGKDTGFALEVRRLSSTRVTGATLNLVTWSVLSQFDWAPLLINNSDADTDDISKLGKEIKYVIGDVNNYTVISNKYLADLNYRIMYGMLMVPITINKFKDTVK